jgi:serine/threonine protein kinase
VGAYVFKSGELFEQRYELLETLGVGGIGTVFKARQVDSNRTVALKIMHTEFAEDEVFQKRFLREGRSLNKLSHPNIVSVYHLGISEQGLPYLVMELVEGESLRRIINTQKRIRPETAIHICKQICSALDAMHKEGIVHRDIKPDNIIIMQTPEHDFVKIIDFGLVRIVEDHQRESQRLTATGVVLGSPAYMSPEQCRGQKVDSRSDIYSLTVCMFEMLAGKAPFASENFVELMYKHAKEPVPVLDASLLGSYTRGLNQFLQKGMSKETEVRYQSALEMLEFLERDALLKSGAAATGLSKKAVKQIAIALLVPSCLGLGGLYLYSHTQSKKNADSVALSQTIQNSAKSRHITMDSLGLLKSENLLLAAQNPTTPDDVKCQAYLMYGWERRTMKEGLDAAERASAIYAKMKAKGIKNEQLAFGSQLLLAEANYCNKNSDQSIDALEKLLSKDTPSQITMQMVLRAKALLAQMYAVKGMNEKSLSLLKEVLRWEYGLSYPASDYAMNTAMKLKRKDLAKKVVLQMSTLGPIADAARVTRSYNEPDVGEVCIEHGKAQIKNTTLNLKNVEKEPLTDAMYNFKIEESWLDIHKGNFESAKMRVSEIAAKTDGIELIKKDCFFTLPLVLIMRRLGLYDDGLAVASMQKNPNIDLKLMMADLFVLKGQLDKAKPFLDEKCSVVDPETGKSVAALERWQRLKDGTADCRKGICTWAGQY